MLYRVLGSTGKRVSAIRLGSWHIGLKYIDEQLGIRIVRTAIDRGISFMDNSWDYNGGVSEIRMGKALRAGYRDKVFLMTKRTFQPMDEQQVVSLLAKTAEAASRGEFEPFKTSSIFDSTAQHPDWLGEEPQLIQQLMPA